MSRRKSEITGSRTTAATISFVRLLCSLKLALACARLWALPIRVL